MNPNAVIVCGEPDAKRYELWLSVLFAAGANTIAVFTDERCGFIAVKGKRSEDKNCEWEDVEAPVHVILVHQGDAAAWRNQVLARKVFWFNTPGFSGGTPGELRICRPTGALNFEVAVDDAREILEFGQGVRVELPSCCSPRRVMSCLPALAILCQGYLAVYAAGNQIESDCDILNALNEMGWVHQKHAELVKSAVLEEVCSAAWWKAVFDLPSTDSGGRATVPEARWESFRALLDREWGFQPFPESFNAILAKLRADETVTFASDVARTYLAIKNRLGNK